MATMRATQTAEDYIPTDEIKNESAVPSPSARVPLKRLINIPVAIGFGIFFAWRDALVTFLYPVSEGFIFSPMVCESFACCLVLFVALFAFMKNRARFPLRSMHITNGIFIALATASGLLVIHDVGGMPFAYIGSIIIGGSLGIILYSWADLLFALKRHVRIGSVVGGLIVAALINGGLGYLGLIGTTVVLIILAILVLASLIISARYGVLPAPEEPLMIRPTSHNHFRLLLLAVVMYALVFGAVSGTMAETASAVLMRDFMQNISLAMLIVAAIALILIFLWGRPIRLSVIGYVLTPILAVLLLLHIPLQGSADGWLPSLTLAFWPFVQVFVILLLIEIAQSGQASMSMVFPLGWALVAFGFAVGALFGQAMQYTYGIDPVAVQTIAASLAIVSVLASSVLSAARYPRVNEENGPALNADLHDGAQEVEEHETVSDRVSDPRTPVPFDPIGSACADLAYRYNLSGRELEVFELLACGNTRANIADKLCISENTVRVHVKNIYSKLHIHSKQQLIDMVDRHL